MRHIATIRFSADIEDTPDWQRSVIHEVLHIKHERLDMFLRESVLPELSGSAHNVVGRTYRDLMEEFIDGETMLLWRLAEATDNPEPAKVGENGHKEIA